MKQPRWFGLSAAAFEHRERALRNAGQAGARIRTRSMQVARSPTALPQAFVAGFLFDQAVATTSQSAWKTLTSRVLLAFKMAWIGQRFLT